MSPFSVAPMPLTAVAINKAKPTGKTNAFFNGGGMYLEISPAASRRRRFTSVADAVLSYHRHMGTPSKHRIGSLDGLRGIFAATVMVGHFCLFETGFQTDAFKNVALCVQFFFILSGFALCYGYGEKMRTGATSFFSFAWQRLARLYPLHLATMLLAFVFIPPIFPLMEKGTLAYNTILNVLLLQAVGFSTWSLNLVSWSISTEFWAGLIVLPLAFRYLSARLALILSVGGYAAIYAMAGYLRTQYWFVVPGVNVGMLSTASAMLLGFALCRWALEIHFSVSLGRAGRTLVGALEFCLLSTILWMSYLAKHGAIEFLCVVLMPLLIFSTAVSKSWMNRFLESRPMLWLGKISYSLYLLHCPILGALTLIGITKIDNLALRFVIYASTVLVMSAISYTYFEHPMYLKLRSLHLPGSKLRAQQFVDQEADGTEKTSPRYT